MISTRKIALGILNNFDTEKEKIPILIKKSFKNKILSKNEKNRIKASVNEVIRYRGILDFVIEKGSRRKVKFIQPKLMNVLRLGIYELLFDDLIPDFAAIHSSVELAKNVINKKTGSMVNAVMRNIQRYNAKHDGWKNSLFEKNIKLAYPNWLIKKWQKQFGKYNTEKLCLFLIKKAPIYIRLDKNKISEESMVSNFSKINIELSKQSKFENFFKVIHGKEKIFETKIFKDGKVSIQDPASGAVVDLINPKKNDIILDACAAPGTKSLYMAQRVGLGGKVYASDKNKKRVDSGKLDIGRHNYKNIQWSVLDATKDEFPTYNKILIDVPCTGTGAIGRRPDIKWRLKSQDIKKMSETQINILNHMARFLSPNGKIVYSTCSLEREENEDVVNKFLKNRSDFKLLVTHSLLPDQWVNSNGFMFAVPYKTKTDGLFAAVLQKKF
jgi:16S rRNA (cytosine967-C5)-methyltransferase